MTDSLGKAIAYAAMAHQDQTDKQGVAYILHPIRVAEAMRRDGGGHTYQMAAILHDTVEDTGILLVDIERHFGPDIRRIVDALTRRESETYKEYVKRCCEDRAAMHVKKYDVYDNINPRRYYKDAPYSRYIWTLDYIDDKGEIQ